MANFVSKLGVLHPANEYVVDPNAPRGKEVYQGPDRDALKIMAENGLIDPETGAIRGYMGQDIRASLEMMDLARQRGFDSVEEMLMKRNGWKKDDFDKKANAVVTEVIDHKNPKAKPPIQELGGGMDTSGQGQHRAGGFEHPNDAANAPRIPK